MNICFVEDTPFCGGGQEWILDTIDQFKNGLNYDIALIVPESNLEMINKAKKLGTTVYTYSWENIPFNKIKYEEAWISGVKNANAVLCSVHPPRNNFHCTAFAAKCIKESGNKALLMPKTGTIVPSYKREYYIPDDEVKTEVITITGFTKKYLVEHYNIPEEKVNVLYQGTNTKKFTSTEFSKHESLKRYPLPRSHSPVLGVIGAFEERKGHIVLLKALKILKEKFYPHVYTMFIGDGPLEEKLKQEVNEFNLKNNVSFYPFTHEANFIYDQMDILVLPSLYKEGLPNVLLEAMSMGVPCIASRLAGTPEIIKDSENGFLFEPGDVDSLVSEIKSLWDDKEQYKYFSSSSRSMINHYFSRENQVDKYSDFIIELLMKNQQYKEKFAKFSR